MGRGQQHAQRHACRRSRSPGPEVDLAAAREYGENGVLSVVTDADQALDRNNRARAVADLRKQAGARGADAACPRGGPPGGRAQLRAAAAGRRIRQCQGRRALSDRRLAGDRAP